MYIGNGYIEGTELDGFLREFVSSVNANDTAPEVRQLYLSNFSSRSILNGITLQPGKSIMPTPFL